MKKILALLLAAAIVLSLAACGKKAEATGPSEPGPDTSGTAQTLDWPKRTITMQVGFKAGGDTDYYARMAAQSLEQILGCSVIVVNTAGVNGQVAAREVMDSDPDGYTTYFTHTVSWWQEACGTVDGFSYVDDFENGGILVADQTFCIVLRADSGIRSMEELIAAVKADPGSLTFSASYAGLADYVALQIERAAGIEFEDVDVGSNATDRITALLNGSCDILAINYTNVADYVTTGEMVVLGVCADERCTYLPDIPTLKEQGIDCSATKYYYFNWPAGTDGAIVAKFNEALKQVSEMPEFAEAIKTFNGEVLYKTADEHKAFARATIADMKSLAG